MYKLSPSSSFIEGFGRTADFDDNLQIYDYSISNQEADAISIYSDFYAIGDDFIYVLEKDAISLDVQKEKKK